jgi:hypothetical protein
VRSSSSTRTSPKICSSFWNAERRIVSLGFLVMLAENTYEREYEVELPIEALRLIARALIDDSAGAQRIDIGHGRVVVLLPRARNGAMLVITNGSRVARATLLRRYQRRQLATGIDHARACAGDPTLLDDAEASA